MISMLPLKISSFLERAPLPQAQVGQARPRLAAAEAPALVPVEATAPDHDRRITASRRTQERRSGEQSTFLDTRTDRGRRRNPGRRAEDQLFPALRRAISVKA
jgi:hypothetical protein